MKLIITIILAGLLIVMGLRLFSRKLLYFPAPLGPAQQKYLKTLGATVKEISLPTEGATLRGWIIEKDMGNLPTIIYFGGNAEEVSLNIEEFSARVAANVVLVNYRGYGLSSGRPTEETLKADGLTLFDFIAGKYSLSPWQCGAWGRSLGSSIASYLVWKRGLGKLILTCPFDSIESVASGFYPAWLVGLVLTDSHKTVEFAGGIKADALILAASDDEIIPMARTRALYDSLRAAKEMVVIQGAGHNTISEFKGYYGAVKGFLEK